MRHPPIPISHKIKTNMLDLNDPKDLYKIILNVYGEYIKEPNERDFIFLVLGFTHLREWICQSKHHEIKNKLQNDIELTNEEIFFDEIYSIPEFQVIQGLCNKTKHYVSREEMPTSKTQGLRAGLAKSGDSLDQLYFLIDGKDSREYFIKIIHKYNEWFSNHG